LCSDFSSPLLGFGLEAWCCGAAWCCGGAGALGRWGWALWGIETFCGARRVLGDEFCTAGFTASLVAAGCPLFLLMALLAVFPELPACGGRGTGCAAAAG
jgi:hypothetical protein